MHRLNATPGGWNPNTEGVIIIDQTPAPIVFLTSADTDIQTLAKSLTYFPSNFPEIRVNNLLNLQQQLSIDTYVETVLSQARIVILRLLGGRTYWSYGLEAVKEITEATDAALWVLPGDDRPDPDLVSHSTIPLAVVNQLWRYFTEGGIENYFNAFCFISDICLNTNYQPPQPQVIPRLGLYPYLTQSKHNYQVGILFYRSHYLAGNTLVIDALCQALIARNLEPVPIFISSLREAEVQAELLNIFQKQPMQILLNTTSFALAQINDESQIQFWQQLNMPILQVILSGSTKQQWETSWQGLTPRDVAMNVALPEVDGRIITTAISFKSVKNWQEKLETDVVIYQPDCDRVNFVADLTANWVKLKQTSVSERKIALILANYPNKDGRIANGVGLDTPASCIEILKACAKAGYWVEDLPASGDELIKRLTTGITNDLESRDIRTVYQSLSIEEYQQYFQTLPEKVQQEIVARWDNVEAIHELPLQNDQLPIPGIQLGNIFVGIQPSRGYDRDPSLNYHAPDLEPTHEYLAYYYWLREKFRVQAIVHVGKHGNLEWLPGKSLALSSTCYPEVVLQTIPNLYPFIVNDPGEGSQAKRRSHAVIIDHLTPPLTRAELYDGLAKLETLIDEYYEAQTLDPARLPTISDRISQLIQQENLDRDLGIKDVDTQSISQFLTIADGYLCELKEAQIRDGLHIFGQCPQGRQLRDLILAIARFPNLNRLGLTSAIALDLGLDFEPLNWREEEEKRRWEDIKDKFAAIREILPNIQFKSPQNLPDVVEILELIAAELVEELIGQSLSKDRCIDAQIDNECSSQSMSTDTHRLTQINYQRLSAFISGSFPHTHRQLQWIETQLLPSLQQTKQEITNLLNALNGKYIPSGASGAPTRGRPEVLPTGRNFYSVDIRAIPTETAWTVGSKAAEAVIERYTQENGEYPKSLAVSIWGTSTMRTGGDDVAQVMALMGVRPIWDNFSRRVVDFEILSPGVLGRPRVDVTVRVSGFFRDSFPNILNLLNNITKAIASLEESPEINPLSAQVKTETKFWQQQGLDQQSASTRASYRIFGSKPGAYGAGLQGLIESQNWQSDEDLARAYINWSSYAYDAQGNGHSAPESFNNRLKQLQIVLHNQDNREHDLLDSDDYYQFQGGLTAAVRSVTGKNPTVYFGDNSLPNNPKVKQLSEEIAKVYRSRVINPKWIAGVMRHGYKGAFEMAATVDYLFAYDATTKCVSDYMYEGIAQAYILDQQVQQFIQDKNPWALRDLAERLLEANQRGMWQEVKQEMLEELKNIVNHTEGIIENLS
ncbi:cobaltochelatase CobN subunit [Stanieria cyanosphaera PCC 7437]|uniref:Cobaltochelatase CobN subunit n=1 Tax=Stanieria cyanosphaera (strain ATCC 29371 / PCC 7437) TaxID=111780 RepID=K9XS79_STAC7|nr:cobaltochelatase subunit CobN [Stanieria cyanosphaera]AFZ34527.1 cobaltochelatase CobN subunit [Stanieria cyanosphaera PCC 7437]